MFLLHPIIFFKWVKKSPFTFPKIKSGCYRQKAIAKATTPSVKRIYHNV